MSYGSFRELRVWREAMDLCAAVYEFTGELPDRERFGLVAQLQRAAVSVPSNIAEGDGRVSAGEWLQFLGHARGSLHALETQILLAAELHMCSMDRADALIKRAQNVGRALSGLIKHARQLKTRGT